MIVFKSSSDYTKSMQKGFSLVEILVVIAIIGILGTISVLQFGDTKTNKLLRITGDDIAFALEETKSNALAGKDGMSQSMHIAPSIYTTFGGTVYVADGSSNKPHTINSIFTLTTTAPSNTITFTRLTGNANGISTTTVSEIANPSNTIHIVVGTLGDITVLQ